MRLAVSLAFGSVGERRIFPVMGQDNQTYTRHIRNGVVMAREARYHNGGAIGGRMPPDEAKVKAWQERGPSMLADTRCLDEAFAELGVFKVTRDLLFWLETHAGVIAAEIKRAFPVATHDKPSSDSLVEKRSAAAGVYCDSTKRPPFGTAC